ncbi:MAG: HdeD family acid-resistance protein [Pirellulaceae bacterium]
MNAPTTPYDLPGMKSLRANWGWFLALGILLMVLGAVAFSAAFATSVVAAVLFGAMLLVGGISQIIHAVFARKWWGSVIQLAVGILYLVFGWLIIKHPFAGLEAITMIIAAFLLASGVLRMALAIQSRGESWFWMALSGVINVLLGLIIWDQLPESSLVVLGLFIGLEMIFNGASWIMISLAVRNLPEEETPAGA